MPLPQISALAQDPHHYVVRHIKPLRSLPSEVRFTSGNPLLEFHDSFHRHPRSLLPCSHLSGAAEYIEDVYHKTQMTCVLADNGSSAELLQFGLSKLDLVYSPA